MKVLRHEAIVRRRLGKGGLLVALVLVLPAVVFDAGLSAQAATARQLVEVVDIGGLSVSPDGRFVAFRTEQASIERNTYDSIWYVQSIDAPAPPVRVAEGGVPLRVGGLSIPEAPQWSADGRWIYYRAALDGRIDVWRAAVDGSRAEPVTRDAADVREYHLSSGGRVLRYSVGASREEVKRAELLEHDQGVHIDRTVPLGDNLFRSGYHGGRLATQRLLENEVERHPLLWATPRRWKAIDLETRVITEGSPPGSTSGRSGFGRVGEPTSGAWKIQEEAGGGRAAILTRTGDASGLRMAPSVEMAVVPINHAGEPVTCRSELCVGKDITDVLWRPGSDEVIFTVTDPARGLAQSVWRWDITTDVVTPIAESAGDLGGGGRWAPGPCAASAHYLLCVSAEANRPPRLERVDLETGSRLVMFDPNESLARLLEESVSAELLSWTDGNGERFTGWFFPAQGRSDPPPPLFVVYYRCTGFLRGSVGDEWPLATLAAHGISALCINAPPSRTDAVERYELGRSAVESVVGLLGAQGLVDPKRVGMGGLSLGAEVTMWTLMNSSVLRAASVGTPVISPMFHLLFSMWDHTFLSRLERFWQLGSPEDTPERWAQISPTEDPGRAAAPVLMQLSEQEYRFSFDYAIPMMRSHQADLYVYPHEPHQKFLPRHKLSAYERNLDWFRFWLQDITDCELEKESQCARWIEMKEWWEER